MPSDVQQTDGYGDKSAEQRKYPGHTRVILTAEQVEHFFLACIRVLVGSVGDGLSRSQSCDGGIRDGDFLLVGDRNPATGVGGGSNGIPGKKSGLGIASSFGELRDGDELGIGGGDVGSVRNEVGSGFSCVNGGLFQLSGCGEGLCGTQFEFTLSQHARGHPPCGADGEA